MLNSPPSDDSYQVVNALFSKGFFNDYEMSVNSLSLTVLELIRKGYIKVDIDCDESYSIGKKIKDKDLKVMNAINFRITSKSGDLKTSEVIATSMLKTVNKSKKFNLKSMYNQIKTTSIANKFKSDYLKYVRILEGENDYSSKEYKDILAESTLSDKGKDLKRQWKDYCKYLKSEKCDDFQLICACCFNIERDVECGDSQLSDFINKDGYKMLNVIFKKALSNAREKSKGDGIFYDINDKYTIPGGG